MTTTDDPPNFVRVAPRPWGRGANGNGNGNEDTPLDQGPGAQPRARVRVRDVAVNAWDYLVPLGHALVEPIRRGEADRQERYTDLERAAPEVGRQSFWREGPASIPDIWAYTRAGAFAPGERHWLLEWGGFAYGVFAIIATIPLYIGAFILQRFSRLVAVVIVVLLALGAHALGWLFTGGA
jgi:hypothetical protein